MPSFLKSTLSLMALLSLLSIILCVFLGITVQSELLAVFTGLIIAYTGSRNSQPTSTNITNVEEQNSPINNT